MGKYFKEQIFKNAAKMFVAEVRETPQKDFEIGSRAFCV